MKKNKCLVENCLYQTFLFLLKKYTLCIMESILNYIVEYKGHAIRNKEKSIGDPDEIKHYFDSGWVHLKFNKDNAYPYVYNKKLNKIIIGKANTIHNNIFSSENEKELKEMGLENVTKIGQIRYCCGEDDDTEEIDKWYEENKQYVDNTICGRLWYDAQDDFESWDSEEQAEQMAAIFGKLKEFDSCKCYVVNWNEIEPNEFQQITDNIVKLFAEKHGKKIKSYIAIDNNGEPIEMFVGENVKVEKRSSEREKEMSKLMDIHNPQHGESWEEFRKRKREATKGYNKARGEHFQRDYYNQTKSKTAAEWHNNKTKRYNPRTGKMEWGEKIGDSLQMKSIIDFINEKQNFLIKGHTKSQGKGYEVYEYVGGGSKHCFVALTSKQDMEDYMKWDKKDEEFTVDYLISHHQWISVWPDKDNKINSINMYNKYLTPEFYRLVGHIPSLDDITVDFYKKHNLIIPE